MIKTLRITSIILAIAAVVLLILPVVYGVRKDPKIDDFLKKPGVVEKFTTAGGQNTTKKDIEKNPLIAMATEYSDKLNPPPPPPPKTPTGGPVTPVNQPPAPQVPVAAKFDLVATSYYAANPEKSFVLIDEAGKGLHWVKQGSTIGHVTIEKVKDGTIVLRDGARTFEMTVKVKETWRSLLKNPPPSTRAVSTSVSPATAIPAVQTPTNPAIQPATAQPGAESPISSPTGSARQNPPPFPNRRIPRPGATPPAADRITSPASPITNNPTQPTPAIEQPRPVETAQPAPAPAASPLPAEPAANPSNPGINPEQQTDMDKLISDVAGAKVTEDEEAKMEKLIDALKKLEDGQNAASGTPEPNRTK
jgi:hypothetical protein